MTTPYVGQPASIVLVTDTMAAVVTKINKKSVVVRRVEDGEYVRDTKRDGTLPVMVADGDLGRVYGEPQRFPLVGYDRDGDPIYRSGSIGLRLGRSVSIRDYRY